MSSRRAARDGKEERDGGGGEARVDGTNKTPDSLSDPTARRPPTVARHPRKVVPFVGRRGLRKLPSARDGGPVVRGREVVQAKVGLALGVPRSALQGKRLTGGRRDRWHSEIRARAAGTIGPRPSRPTEPSRRPPDEPTHTSTLEPSRCKQVCRSCRACCLPFPVSQCQRAMRAAGCR
jgi:hypothetical protein